jgi:hypothetical protein
MPDRKPCVCAWMIFRIQKKVIRLIAGVNKRTSCRSIFSQYKILTLPSLYILVSLCFIKKLNDNLECNSQKYHYSTRGKNKIYIRACKTAVLQNSVLNRASRLFNKLPERIRILENLRSFKKEVKILLFTKKFYSVDESLHSNFSLKKS